MSTPSLTFVEEIVLLALDDTTGARLPMPVMALGYTLAGALLADLALRNCIDTDVQQLVVLRREPTGDPLLDSALATLAAAKPRPVSDWLAAFSDSGVALEESALARLVARGILRREEKKVLWVFGQRRYPTVDTQERTEVRTRLAALILGEELPDPRDAVLISLLGASGLLLRIFPGPEFAARAARIATLSKMDLVGREVAAAIDTVTQVLQTALPIGM